MSKIMPSDIIADFHIHTAASLHAYSTVKECISEAINSGMKYIAITDHYYGYTEFIERKNEIARFIHLEEHVNRRNNDIQIIGGAEFNIGQDASDWGKYEQLKIRIGGLHSWFIDVGNISLQDLYDEYNAVCHKYNIFGHIERELEKVNNYGAELTKDMKDYLESIVILAGDNNVYLELNEASLRKRGRGNTERIKFWIERALKHGVKITLGSDAHYCSEVGKFSGIVEILNDIDFPKENIVNCNEELIIKLLKR